MESSLTLKELNNLIKSTIEVQFKAPLWVVAEINNVNEHRSGHCYLELVQKSETKDVIVAQSRAVIWATQYRFISSFFEAITNQKLTKGIKILVKVSVDFHELYGLSLNIRDIDPNYTLGDLERRRKEIIAKLQSEGIIDMNRDLQLPSVIQKIAVISSSSAAGFEDFVKQLSSNKYGYVYNISLFEADMQGQNTENAIIAALENIFDKHEEFDVVAIIRGGGSKSDLSSFDNYNIAFHITQFPLPVFSGIGHERDESVTDMVAHTKLKTPTAVANFMIDHNLKFENKLDDEYNYLIDCIKDILKTQELYLTGLGMDILKIKDILSQNIERCNAYYYKIQNTATNKLNLEKNNISNYERLFKGSILALVAQKNNELEAKSQKLKRSMLYFIANESNKLDFMDQKIKLLSPSSVLKRGYSMSLLNGKIIKNQGDVKEGDIIETILNKGKIRSRITE